LNALHARYKDQVHFVGVYVREAHAGDGWWPMLDKTTGEVRQPKTTEERCKVAQKCIESLKLTMPIVIDKIDDEVGHAYSGMPDRLYVLDAKGKVTYKGGRGPFGFNPQEMEQILLLTLLEQDKAR
jgi:hypothetical protein